jgi:hypothetical protein
VKKKGNVHMTLKEILKAKGVADDVIESIMGDMKTHKIFTASEENLDIRFGKLKADHDALTAKDAESQKLIAELQSATKGQENVQKQIADYQAQIARQQEELNHAKTESALKIGLLSAGAKASDIDYLIFKLSHDSDWKPELDDNDQVKGLDDKVKGLKTQFPAQFEISSSKKIDEKKLDKPDNKQTTTKDEFKKMGYQAKLKLFNENPDLYNELSNE